MHIYMTLYYTCHYCAGLCNEWIHIYYLRNTKISRVPRGCPRPIVHVRLAHAHACTTPKRKKKPAQNLILVNLNTSHVYYQLQSEPMSRYMCNSRAGTQQGAGTITCTAEPRLSRLLWSQEIYRCPDK